MFDRLRRITVLLSVLVLVVFVVFVINQTAQVVELADRVHPVFGTTVLVVLLAAYLVLLAVPIVMYFRLPPPIEPPSTDEGPEFEAHLERLRARLASNPRLAGMPLETREDLEAAIKQLDKAATDVVRVAAAQVFMSTAISQSGRLDAFVVLSANVRLVWQIAVVYYQRPTLRDMWHLYANVAATAFMAGEIDDVDVSEQVQPIITSVLGSVGTAVPGLQVATSLIVNSVLTGSTNAFLTLRVGAIAEQYCAPMVTDRRTIRRFATARAASMLGSIVGSGARSVVRAVVKASGDRLLRRKGRDLEPEDAAEEGETPRRRWFRRRADDADPYGDDLAGGDEPADDVAAGTSAGGEGADGTGAAY